MAGPVLPFLVEPTVSFEHVFHQERNHVGELYALFLTIGEAGNGTAFNQWLAVVARVTENRRCVADRAHRFARIVKRFNQGNRGGIFCQIPKRAVPARIEHRIKCIGVYFRQSPSVGQCGLSLAVLVESVRGCGLCVRCGAVWVERGLTAFGRSQGDLRTGIFENIVGCGELLQPKTGFMAGICLLYTSPSPRDRG